MINPPIGFETFDSLSQLHEAATNAFRELANSCLEANGKFRVSLSGGSTPKRLYEMIAELELPWDDVHFFWGDERNVPLDHLDSNARMVREALLDRIDIPAANVHEVPVNVGEPALAAEVYEQSLRRIFSDAKFPVWDLVLLGMGDDAHTASLFPSTKALQERERWFVENWVEKFDAFRYTLTPPAINSANEIWFLVSGSGKREALAHVLSTEKKTDLYPSQLVSPSRWFVTRDAT